MLLNELKKAKGSTKKKFQKGRGIGSGNGKTCGKGHKGQRSRSGHMKKEGFQGGQNPLRMPKCLRSPKIKKKKRYAIVKLDILNNYKNDTKIDINLLKKDGFIKSKFNSFKILDGNEFSKKIQVITNKISALAKKKIQDLGGNVEIIKNK